MMEKDIPANTYQKKMGIATIISDIADFRARKVRGKERCYIRIKKLIFQKNITILNVYVSTTKH